MSQSSISLMRRTRVARSATICPMASPLNVSSICRASQSQIARCRQAPDNLADLSPSHVHGADAVLNASRAQPFPWPYSTSTASYCPIPCTSKLAWS